MMLWFSDQNRFLIFQSGNAGTWSEISGPPYPTDSCVYKQACVDVCEKAPKGLHVPIGGGYLLWKERNLQKDLGFMTGYCICWDAVTSQNFERGRLIGPVLPSPVTRLANALAIYAGKDRTSWDWAALPMVGPPDCHMSND
jgi:hypothetical protein